MRTECMECLLVTAARPRRGQARKLMTQRFHGMSRSLARSSVAVDMTWIQSNLTVKSRVSSVWARGRGRWQFIGPDLPVAVSSLATVTRDCVRDSDSVA